MSSLLGGFASLPGNIIDGFALIITNPPLIAAGALVALATGMKILQICQRRSNRS